MTDPMYEKTRTGAEMSQCSVGKWVGRGYWAFIYPPTGNMTNFLLLNPRLFFLTPAGQHKRQCSCPFLGWFLSSFCPGRY